MCRARSKWRSGEFSSPKLRLLLTDGEAWKLRKNALAQCASCQCPSPGGEIKVATDARQSPPEEAESILPPLESGLPPTAWTL